MSLFLLLLLGVKCRNAGYFFQFGENKRPAPFFLTSLAALVQAGQNASLVMRKSSVQIREAALGTKCRDGILHPLKRRGRRFESFRRRHGGVAQLVERYKQSPVSLFLVPQSCSMCRFGLLQWFDSVHSHCVGMLHLGAFPSPSFLEHLASLAQSAERRSCKAKVPGS